MLDPGKTMDGRCPILCALVLLAVAMIPIRSPFASACANPPGPPGASAAFVSDDPAVTRAVQLFAAGRFREAEEALRDAPEPESSELREVIRRTRRDYSLIPDQLLEKLRASIPDATKDDISRWIDKGQIQHRVIDGQVAIFRREPGHLLRFCDEAKQRRDAARSTTEPAKGDPPPWALHAHLAEVMAEASTAGSSEVLPVRHRIVYRLTVKPDRPGARAGSTLAVWLPFPQEYARQRDVRLIRSDPGNAVIAPSAVDGFPITGAAQRTVYLEREIDDPTQPQVFEIEFEFTTSAFYPDLDAPREPSKTDPSRFAEYLAERPPHIVFTPEIRSRVDEIVRNETDPLSRARRIFEWIDSNVRWTPEEEYSIIPNLSMHGLTRGKGDCGVASMLFITMCRVAGVPARWQSGWTTNPVGWNMHDWAEIYVHPWGWIPVDASYGRQKSDDPRIRDFYFGHLDSYRLIVNLDYGHELHPPKSTFRSEPLDFQRGEVELDGRNLYFDDWEYQIRFHREPGP